MKPLHGHTALLIFAISVTLFVSALYGYIYFLVHTTADRAVLARDIVRAEALTKDQEQKLAVAYDATVADRARLGSFFIPYDSIVLFIESIESLGTQAGSTVTLTTITSDPLDGAPAGTLGNIHAQVDAHGSWESVMRTLQLAELMPYNSVLRDVRLDSSSVTVGKEVKRVWHLSFVMDVSTIATPSAKTK
jgi:hypothetical protein